MFYLCRVLIILHYLGSALYCCICISAQTTIYIYQLNDNMLTCLPMLIRARRVEWPIRPLFYQPSNIALLSTCTILHPNVPYVGYKQFIYTTAAAVGYELHAYVYALSKISICDPQQSNYRIKTSASRLAQRYHLVTSASASPNMLVLRTSNPSTGCSSTTAPSNVR